MNETMQQIHKLANERHMLYRLASHQGYSNADRQRLQQLNSELPLLWDRYRREYAARRQPLAPEFSRLQAA